MKDAVIAALAALAWPLGLEAVVLPGSEQSGWNIGC